MKNRRCMALWFLIAILGLAWSSAGMAASVNKHFSLSMVVFSTTNNQSGNKVTATLTNDNPSGSNAQISSWIISVANASGITITAAAPDPNFPNFVVNLLSPTSVSVHVKTDKLPSLKANQAYTLTLTINGCGDGNQWSAQAFAGSNFNGGNYIDDTQFPANKVTNISCGLVGCSSNQQLAGNTVSAILASGSMRGPFNQDGACPANEGVNYFVTDLLGSNQYLQVRWDQTQPDAVFFYKVDGIPGGTAPQVAWLTDVNNNPVFITAPQCFGGAGAVTPAPFGTLISDSGGTTIDVDTSSGTYMPPVPPFAPFPIILGPKNVEEYLMVTDIDGTTWTVTRGANATVHAPGTPVMSTPKVLLPNGVSPPYQAGAMSQMCYVPDPNNAIIFDIGDGYVKPSL